MMLAYIWPVALVVPSNVAYHICAKSAPAEMNPLASLTVTYPVGAVVSVILYFILNRGGNLAAEYKKGQLGSVRAGHRDLLNGPRIYQHEVRNV